MDQENKIQQNREESEERLRFLESAVKRTNNALKSIKVLGNCSNKNLYKYTPEDINKIFSALEKTLLETKARFTFTDDEDEFKL
jgi:hypothetical protein